LLPEWNHIVSWEEFYFTDGMMEDTCGLKEFKSASSIAEAET
jgi:hypothetical protein